MDEQNIKETQQGQTENELQARLDACQAACNEWKDKYIHVSADLQNYKRRVEKEQTIWIARAQMDMLLPLLTIVDDFDRALCEHHSREKTVELDQWLKGFELIGKELYKYLHAMGVSEIKETVYFDPNLHEAIVQVESDKHNSGDIVDVLQKGFMLKDQVLRPAKVTVAK
jgi:molecular chaperone GrpE